MARVSGKRDVEQRLLKLGQTIRAQRLALEMSQEALADAAGIDRSHMGKIERGERNVTLLNILKIASALDRPASALLSASGL